MKMKIVLFGLINSGNFKSGENYNKKLDLRRIKK